MTSTTCSRANGDRNQVRCGRGLTSSSRRSSSLPILEVIRSRRSRGRPTILSRRQGKFVADAIVERHEANGQLFNAFYEKPGFREDVMKFLAGSYDDIREGTTS